MGTNTPSKNNPRLRPAGDPADPLLGAAIRLARAGNLPELLEAVDASVRAADAGAAGGLGIYEARKRVLVIYGPPAGGAATWAPGLSADGEEFSLDDAEASSFLTDPTAYSSPPLSPDSRLPLHKRFYEAGVRRYLGVPLFYRQQFLGALYALCSGPGDTGGPCLDYLDQLAVLLAPALWNQRTHDRLAKGDRRRANLVELSHAINTSLQLQPVLHSARQAIGQIEGHCVSIIGLLNEDRRSFRAYWHRREPQRADGGRQYPEVIAVDATALAWVLEHRKTYESGALRVGLRYEIDAALQDAGARRYVVAPMFVRGKVIGGFFFGTTDPHPTLTTDVWLYENIALQLALAVDNAMQFEQLKALSNKLEQQNVYLREEIDSDHNVEGMIGRSAAMQTVFAEIGRVAATDASVLIMGPTGVGKELVARAIHAKSERADHPLVKINCAAIPENLVESELFGHERGAFTSAVSRKIGRFELARDGTLFLDEVGELPLPIQAKLLRVLQDGEFERVGGTETISTNARIIAATNRDLGAAIESGTFRSDLYYRLNVFPIEVPPLAERPDDIPLLVESFIFQFSRRMGRNVESLDPQSLDYLCRRDWPGNVRELRHVIERAMIMCDDACLVIEPTVPAVREATSSAAGRSWIAPVPPQPAPAVATLQEMERDHIAQALQRTGGVIDGPRGAARLLGLKPSTLRSRMKRLGVRRARP